MIKAILTDIEGTTSSISFVKDTLFPYARTKMKPYLLQHAASPEIKTQLDAVKSLADKPLDLEGCINQLCKWIDEDRKATPLKAIQGMIWQDGYRSGDFHGHLYPDAHDGLLRWKSSGLKLYVFSSGSIKAQKLLFAHTVYGDLTPWFSGYFDTTTGPKQERESYESIARSIGFEPTEILFLSDIEAELDAAKNAGYRTLQLVRDPESSRSTRHQVATRFDEIQP